MYTTQLQAGLGLIPETRLLLDIWEARMSTSDLYRHALRSGEFPNISARRLRNIVAECFAPRYLIDEGAPARYLKQFGSILTSTELSQLFLIYTSRANLILADFVREVYWGRYAAGDNFVKNEDVREFISRAIDDGKTSKRWAPSTVKRVASYLLGCCADYGMLGERTSDGRRNIPYRIEANVSAFLVHDLHFSGLSDNRVTSHSDWQLFGLAKSDVQDGLKRLSLKGLLIYQSVGDVAHIGWKYKNMQEFVDVLAES